MASTPLNANRFLTNTAKNSNRIKLKISGGVVSGNIGPTSPASTICIDQLDFSCEQNSQYIPLI